VTVGDQRVVTDRQVAVVVAHPPTDDRIAVGRGNPQTERSNTAAGMIST
jgi:hypothetical protein